MADERQIAATYMEPEEQELNIKKMLYVLFRKRWILYSIFFIVMTIDVIYTYNQIPTYRATSLVLIETPASSTQTSGTMSTQEVLPEIGNSEYYNTQYEILKSRTLSKRVSAALNLKLYESFKGVDFPEDRLQEMITIEPIRKSRLVKVSIDHTNPAVATKITNALVSIYIEQNIESLLFMSKEVMKAFPEDSEEIEQHTIYGQLKDISKEEAMESLPAIINNVVLQNMKAEKMTVESEIAKLSKRYKEKHPKMAALLNKLKFLDDKIKIETKKTLSSLRSDLAGRLQANNIRVIDYAMIPRSPIKPKKTQNLMVGFLFSIFFGVGLIFFTEHIDDTVRNDDDVKRIGLPFLGDFPLLPNKKINAAFNEGEFEKLDKDPQAFESIRNIRVNVIFSMPNAKLKSLLLTSTVPKEGKSFLSAYLAYSFAKNGSKTLVMDADIRKPRVHEMFNIKQEPGLTNILVENLSPDTVITKSKYANLDILPCGQHAPNPVELIASDSMKMLYKKLTEKYDMIIIDAPPCFMIPDALVLSHLASATALVVKSGLVCRDVLSKIKEKLETSDTKIAGVVVNCSKKESDSYFRHRYYHKYYKSYYDAHGKEKKNDKIDKKVAANKKETKEA